LVTSFRRVRRRLLVVRALETGLAGFLGASIFAALLTLIRILLPERVPVASAHPWLPLALAACGFAIGFVVRLALGVSLREAAIAADRAAGLKERLATALEVMASAAPPGGEHRPGLLDDRLLEQARAAAAPLEPSRLAFGRSLGRLAKAALVAVFVLVGWAFIPSVGGPPLAPQAAARAAETLERVANQSAVAPALREKIEEVVERIRQSGARQGTADRATQELYQEAGRIETARKGALNALRQVDSREFQKMVGQAFQGDAEGARAAAKELSDKLAAPPTAGGMPLADRERLADGLTGAAATADPKDLGDLAKELAAAAEAIRKGDPGAAERLRRLAEKLTRHFGEKPGGVAALVQGVGEARRAMGLAESPPAELAESGLGPLAGGTEPAPGQVGTVSPTVTPGVAPTPVTPTAVPPEVRPEDRDVVRRYFGG
jgi:TolA-binding protein